MRLFRQIIASIVLICSTLYIAGISAYLPAWISMDFLINIQVVPAILSGSIAVLIAITALSVLLGRFYCSAICPLGIMQDLIIRLSNKIHKKHGGKRPQTYYKKPHNLLRYSLLVLSILSLILGSSYLLLLLDPYSIFGRIGASVITPLITLVNNLIANITNAAGHYTFSHRAYHWPGIAVIISSALSLGLIVFLNIKYGRLWCNTLCPVGALLGLISRVSIFKIHIDKEKCTQCKACAKSCKTHTIDYLHDYSIDHSRCVSCYNCIDACHFDALKLSSNMKTKDK